jgi:malate dehydrogenase
MLKISLIGAGNIGSTIAHLLSLNNIANVVMFDITDGLPQGRALDIMQSSALNNCNINIKGTNDYSDIENSDIIVVTSGSPRKPGMTRDDLLNINSEIIKTVAMNIKKYSSNSFIIVVTNPLDIMVSLMFNELTIAKNKIVGMAGSLDSARFSYFLAEEFNVSYENVSSMVIGSHNDKMLPLVRYATINAIPIMELVNLGFSSKSNIDKIVERTKTAGVEIVNLLKNGSAYYSPAFSCVEIIEAYLRNKRKIIPCSVYLQNLYGVNDIFAGVPVIIGRNGIEKIIELNLNNEEQILFKSSIDSIYK